MAKRNKRIGVSFSVCGYDLYSISFTVGRYGGYHSRENEVLLIDGRYQVSENESMATGSWFHRNWVFADWHSATERVKTIMEHAAKGKISAYMDKCHREEEKAKQPTHSSLLLEKQKYE